MAVIKKINSISAKESLVVVTNRFKPEARFGLSENELAYISAQIGLGKKLVKINQLSRFVFIALIEDKKTPAQQLELLRRTGSSIAAILNENRQETVGILCELSGKPYATALAEGMALGSYQFIRHRTKGKNELQHTLATINLAGKNAVSKEIEELNIVLEATNHARDLVNEPVNLLNAVGLAKDFQELGKKGGFQVEVFNKAKIVAMKMGGLLSVNQGSIDPPTFTVMEYKPARPKNKKPIVLVGKGVVYDTGGLSLKPTANSMDMMKCDMAGAAAVACAIYAVAKAKLPVHVIALVPATDNRPGGNAFAPGDIITMYDGTTVEMLNSDAEGRMILADALTYAKQYKPELLIELSTLTGAAAAAIGQYGIVSMGTAGDRVHGTLKKSGEHTHERLAEFPFWEEYDDLLKSDIADMKNLGGPQAGAITAGKFLARFTDYPYIHLDIAGPAFLTVPDTYKPKGGTGVGVRLLFNFLKNV